MKKQALHHMVLTALFTAVLIILSQIAIPMPSGIPLTLQTFAISLCGYMLKTKQGCLSVFLYLLLGAVGLPIFSNFRGGLGVLLGPTGGFLFGFLLLVFFCGISAKKNLFHLLLGMIGLILCHLIGILQYSLITDQPFLASLLFISLPYFPKDFLLLCTAYFSSLGICKILKHNGFAF